MPTLTTLGGAVITFNPSAIDAIAINRHCNRSPARPRHPDSDRKAAESGSALTTTKL